MKTWLAENLALRAARDAMDAQKRREADEALERARAEAAERNLLRDLVRAFRL